MPEAKERAEERKPSLVAPNPPRERGQVPNREPPTLIRGDLGGYIESERLGLHTHNEQHVHGCSAKWESPREKFWLLRVLEALAGSGQP